MYLVGAGPGDPGLLTLKGKRCLERAEVILYDSLANEALLTHAPPQAERIPVGKRGGEDSVSQEEITRLLLRHAAEGKTVVRLKGGDPFLFGRGGEEAEELAKAGVPYEVVPGVSAALAVPAYAGIPLTHRDYASAVAILTGHEDPTKETSEMEWERIAHIPTLVLLMGARSLPDVTRRLIEAGRSPETPTALIRWGTRATQQTLVGTLRDIAERAATSGFAPPALAVVGEVVRLRETLAWFESKPLFGRRILVTRSRDKASTLIEQLEEHGAEVIEFPTIAFIPPESWAPLDAAIGRIGEYRWILFTSVNGVRFFWERLESAHKDTRSLGDVKIAAIGPATAEALRRHGVQADLVPTQFQAEGLCAALGENLTDVRILIPAATGAREILPQELTRRGAQVDVVPTYRTIAPHEDTERVCALLRERALDIITFTSSSTVQHFCRALGEEAASLLRGVQVACIGPLTAAAARTQGLSVDILARENTLPALVEAIVMGRRMQKDTELPHSHA